VEKGGGFVSLSLSLSPLMVPRGPTQVACPPFSPADWKTGAKLLFTKGNVFVFVIVVASGFKNLFFTLVSSVTG